jgi:hypothetical protein
MQRLRLYARAFRVLVYPRKRSRVHGSLPAGIPVLAAHIDIDS